MQLCLLHSWPCCHFHAEIKLNQIDLPTPPPNTTADMGSAPSDSLLIKCLLTETAVVALKDSSPVPGLHRLSAERVNPGTALCCVCSSLCCVCSSLCCVCSSLCCVCSSLLCVLVSVLCVLVSVLCVLVSVLCVLVSVPFVFWSGWEIGLKV